LRLLVAVLIFGIAFLTLARMSSSAFKITMCNEPPGCTQPDTLARYYAAETLTTVGYGNWIPPGIPEGDYRVYRMKGLSIYYMYFGASLFALLIGLIANAVFQVTWRPPFH